MGGTYNFIDHTADIAVKVSADSLEELFITSAKALLACTAEEISFRSTEKKRLNLNEYSSEELLVSFLNELNFFFSSKKWLLRNIEKIKIEEYENIWQLKTECTGSSEVDYIPKDEIKAVTFHQMEIKFSRDIYETIIVFDI
jgi:SHS2 domain-containing protein